MRRHWWLPAVAVGLVVPVSGCSADRCEEAFTAVTMSVDGVASATWDCSDQFGGGWQRGDVVIEASDEDGAIEVMDAILRAYAASPDLEDRWSVPQEFKTRDRSIIVSAGDLGFNGPPKLREVREHYGVTPG
ncbi:hypothetical protein [Amycolatopsis magusensis]|uniref:Lipoprotein n=1 Tax=Amycolatopsis magusensis TaxID=882444 RepID=A0ABS4PXV2_9PSEU|nr:hypothetical protein [Amycolatopsis magusensis]MBP2184262.1 hypothetical protein [Amycolatopsis magusensis]